MSEEKELKSTVQVKLPRSFYDFYFKYHLWDEYSSFADWIRDAVRKDRESQRIRKKVEELG